MLRKAMNEKLFSLLDETHRFNGISELLDFMTAIISGFVVPLRVEHAMFF